VVRGEEEDTFGTLDSGAVRKLADFVQIEKTPNSTIVAGIARIAYCYAAGMSSSGTPSRPALLDFVHLHNPRLVEAAALASAARDAVRASPFGAVLFLALEGGRYDDLIREFVHGIVSGVDLKVGDARHTLREWVHRGLARRNSTALTADMVLGASIRAWNAYAYDRPLKAISNLMQVTQKTMPIVGYQQRLFPEVPMIASAAEAPKREVDYHRRRGKHPKESLGDAPDAQERAP
jgi:hypothetical protein